VKGAQFMPKSDTSTSKDDKVVINGKKYQQCASPLHLLLDLLSQVEESGFTCRQRH